MAKQWLKSEVFRASLEGMGVLSPTETFKDWPGDPTEDEIDASVEGAEKSEKFDGGCMFSYPEALNSASPDRTIRLLELLPGKPLDFIRCRLRPKLLATAMLEYEALSYVWGDVTATKPIQLNDAVFHVTNNLRSALRHLRLPDRTRFLWVDAICINQQDLDETAHQVSMMGDIYRFAQQVLVWLGLSEDHTENTFTALRNLATGSRPAPETMKEAHDAKKALTISSDQGDRIKGLMDYEWFQRSWTVQEIISPRCGVVICGWQSISWSDVIDGVSFAVTNNSFNMREINYGAAENEFPQLDALKEARHIIEQPHEAQDQLLFLIEKFHTRNATDPRDKVYAFLGLVPDSDKLGIAVDYRIDFKDLYRDVAVRLISLSGSLSLLRILPTDDPSSTHEDKPELSTENTVLPSWTPNWAQVAAGALPLPFTHSRQLGAVQDIDFSDNHKMLTLAGHILDEITEVSEILTPVTDLRIMDDLLEKQTDDNEQGILETFREAFGLLGEGITELFKLIKPGETLIRWEQFAGLPPLDAHKDATKAALVDRYWQTICAGALLPEGLEETRAEFWTWYHELDPIRDWQRRWYKRFTSVSTPMSFLGHLRATWSKFSRIDSLLMVAYRRRLAKTRGGRLALVPRTTRVGDAVMLCGASGFPLVIRETVADAERWNFVGQAYIHDLQDIPMDGSRSQWLHFV